MKLYMTLEWLHNEIYNNIVLGSMTYLSKLYITVRSGKNSAKYIMKPKKNSTRF